MISEAHIKRFQEIYEKRYGRKISKDEAIDKGGKIIQLFKVVIGLGDSVNSKNRNDKHNDERKYDE